jgi:hypothetical protein
MRSVGGGIELLIKLMLKRQVRKEKIGKPFAEGTEGGAQ